MRRVLLVASLVFLCEGQERVSSPASTWSVSAEHQATDGQVFHATGHVEMSSAGMRLRADSIDYDMVSSVLRLNGHVMIQIPNRDGLEADEAEYDAKSGDLTLKLRVTPPK